MKNLLQKKIRGVTFVVFSAVGGLAFGAALAVAATTISTSILTGGTLGVTGLSSLGQASSTMLSTGSAYFGATATSTFSSAGDLTLKGALTLQNGEVITNSTDGTVSIAAGGDVVKILGTASTSALRVGGDQNNSIAGIITGSCTIAATALTASTTSYVNCTGATGVTNSYSVVVTPTSLPAPVVIQSASTTGTTGTIQIGLLDTGLATTTSGGIPATTVNFWAFR